MLDHPAVNGREFVRHAKRFAGKSGRTFRFNPSVGKGSHGRVYVGMRFTTVPRKEIGEVLLSAMLKDLDIDKEEF